MLEIIEKKGGGGSSELDCGSDQLPTRASIDGAVLRDRMIG